MNKTKNTDYEKDAKTVAKELVGKVLVYEGTEAKILKTEAFEACSEGKKYDCLYAEPGQIRFAKSHGYNMINIGTASQSKPSCVQINSISIDGKVIDGPGRVCKNIGESIEYMVVGKGYQIIGDTEPSKFERTVNGAANSLGKYFIKE